MKFVAVLFPVAVAVLLDTLFYASSGRKHLLDSLFRTVDDTEPAKEWLTLRKTLKLDDVKVLEYGGAVQGAEAFLQDPAGGVYTGLIDGRIVKLLSDDDYVDIACLGSNCGGKCDLAAAKKKQKEGKNLSPNSCSRPLGLQFLDPEAAAAGTDKTLLVCDVFRGLLKVHVPPGQYRRDRHEPSHFDVLLSEADGKRPYFSNALLKHGDYVYFTDSSQSNNFGTKGRIILEPEPTGRLLEFNLKTKRATVVLERLAFPNGLAFTPSRDAILMVETKTRSIKKIHIAGPRKGQVKVWASDLPFVPDNITELPNGLGYIVGSAFVKKFPSSIQVSSPSVALSILKALHRRVANGLFFTHLQTVGEILYPLTEFEAFSVALDWLLTHLGGGGHLFHLDTQGTVRRWISLPRECSAVSEGFVASWGKFPSAGSVELSDVSHFLLAGSFAKNGICKIPLSALVDPK
uniref:Os07g0543600 protein, related n=1 Tax=Neospora caninum (strain Liverpool) TaxID=572307 RepID=A0A0F7UIL7_NEOCL|nr:TPA: Os07g0543600 protein, related [Neospora caninum Liverpool]